MVAACAWFEAPAHAFEAGEVAGHPLTIDITETAVVNYNFDNRNTRAHSVQSRVDDDWGEWRNRLTTQASWWRLVGNLRLDSSVFFHTPNPNELADEELSDVPNVTPEERRARVDAYGRELSTRYLNAVYPSKLFVSYVVPGFEATVGDVYAQFGRGLVLSVRKIDELAVDTTIRGGKLSYRRPVGSGARVGMTLVGGYTNPVRIDEATGRVLQAPSQWLFPAMPQPTETPYVSDPQATFVPDRIVGASLEGGSSSKVTVGTHAVLLDRAPPCALLSSGSVCTPFDPGSGNRAAAQVRNLSQSISLPDIAGHGSVYVEAAVQQQRAEVVEPGDYDPDFFTPPDRRNDQQGYALYASVAANAEPVTVTLEGKNYRRFFPLEANTDPRRAGEFELLQYSAPPTTLPIYVDSEFGFFNTCVTGGRGRVDVRINDQWLVYGWLGRYASWAERGEADCEISRERRNDVWDGAVGVESFFEAKKSHVFAWAGVRDDQIAEVVDRGAYPTDVFYREGYVRYDVVKRLVRRFSLQVTGTARRRYFPLETLDAWWEGENYTALQWSPHLTAAFGYEYTTQEAVPPNYFNGSVTWRFDSDTSVRLFVGQQRGAQRCISGVCRQFPPFEGAKAEAVVRF